MTGGRKVRRPVKRGGLQAPPANWLERTPRSKPTEASSSPLAAELNARVGPRNERPATGVQVLQLAAGPVGGGLGGGGPGVVEPSWARAAWGDTPSITSVIDARVSIFAQFIGLWPLRPGPAA